MIPLFHFDIKRGDLSEIINSVEEIIQSEQYVLGDNTSKFEKNYANLINSNHCVGVGSGLVLL